LWGANAVNGVINIITKNSSETQGGSLNAGGGTEETGFGSFRYGTKLGEDTTARVYAKGFDRDSNTLKTGGQANDGWSKAQGGFRMDSHVSDKDAVTLQGDIFQADINQTSVLKQISPPFSNIQSNELGSSGGNILGRLQHTFSPTSDYSLQMYFDTYTRTEPTYTDSRDTFDVDFQHRFALFDTHQVIWGLSYRYGHDHIVGKSLQDGTESFLISPASVNDQVFSGFVQDEVALINNKLWLTIGSKFEHNDYSGFEGQPSARIMWAPHNQHRVWAGVSRAVRTPSRAEQDFRLLTQVVPGQTLPTPPYFIPTTGIYSQGSPNYKAEEVVAYEIGYRTTFSKSASLDVTGFYNDYKSLRLGVLGTPAFNPNNNSV
jgi:iron complex outermembrane receptor protein